MKMKNIISTILLAVYSIVLGHNIVPHHHHFENSQNPDFYCQLDEVQQSCCDSSLADDHEHDSKHHHPCNFNEKIVLKKSGNFSVLYLPGPAFEFEFSIQEKKIFYASYTVKASTDPNLRHILVRGPPQLS